MAKSKVRFIPLKLRGSASVKKKRIRQANGKSVSVHFIDTESPTFDIDLSAIFAKNVARARRENSSLPLRKFPGILRNKRDLASSLLLLDVHFKPTPKKKRRLSKPRQKQS